MTASNARLAEPTANVSTPTAKGAAAKRRKPVQHITARIKGSNKKSNSYNRRRKRRGSLGSKIKSHYIKLHNRSINILLLVNNT